VEDAGRAFEAFLARSEAHVVRRKKDRDARVEVRGSILLLEVERAEDALRIRLGLRMSPQGAVKPAEVLEAALGAVPASFTLRREDLLVAEKEGWVSPLEGAGADPARLLIRGDAAPAPLASRLSSAITPPVAPLAAAAPAGALELAREGLASAVAGESAVVEAATEATAADVEAAVASAA
jgi:hypothetical protein